MNQSISPNQWRPVGKNLPWYKKLLRFVPTFKSFNLPSIDFVRVFICFGIISFVTLFGFGLYIINKIADAYIVKSKKIDIRIEENLTPIIAKVESIEDKVNNLKAHAIIKYYKIPKKKRYAIQKGGKTVGYTYR